MKECYEKALPLAGPNDAGLALLRDRATALTNYVEFASHRDDASYLRPRLINLPMPQYTDRQRRVRSRAK